MSERNDTVNVMLYEMQPDLTPRAYLMALQCLPGLNVEKAIKAATKDYLESPEGKKTLERTCGMFTYLDFAENVTPVFTEPHGFVIRGLDTTGVLTLDANIILNPEEE